MLSWTGRFKTVAYSCHKRIRRNYASKPKGRSEWKSTIGLEIHAQLATDSKLFSTALSAYGHPTNSTVNLFDAAIPGTLPVLNKKAVELAVLTSLALKCDINPVSMFDRKHYFYADLPNGYQITQQRKPIAQNGSLDYAVFNPSIHKKPYYKTTKIKQIQLEQDSGKSLHMVDTKDTFIDLNRAGIALIEIVFEPDVDDAEEAVAVVKDLCSILQRVGSCHCKMEEGGLRVDANVSVHKEGTELGVRTEIKNIGSIRGVAQAVNYEVARQIRILENGGVVLNQTLAWDAVENRMNILRDKESHHDYRFMPEPNLPPLRIAVENAQRDKSASNVLDLTHLKDKVPPLPQDERNLLLNKYGASDLVAYNIVNIPHLYKYFTDIISDDPSRPPKSIYHVLMNTLLTALNNCNIDISECTISSAQLGEIVDLRANKITEKAGKIILEEILKGNRQSPKEIAAAKDLYMISDEEIERLVIDLCAKNPDALQQCLKGKKKAMNFFINSVMTAREGKAPFVAVERILGEVLAAKKRNPKE